VYFLVLTTRSTASRDRRRPPRGSSAI
jgi:hypothetical protein